MMGSDLPPGSCNSTGHLSTIGYHSAPGRMHHSTSTPAGVDGAGGGSRTPPITPKKGGKILAVRVQMLDDTISMFQIQSKALGRVLFEQVCRQLHLLEADYFGLEYQDANLTKYWLDVEKPMCRQLGLSMLEPTLRFCVKFYTPDPARLEEEFTRYLFCLQVKRDLAQGCIQCNENTAALMASYIVQAECGDFVREDYPDHTYLSGYKFFPGQDAECERRIMENHKKHIGQSPAEADLNLLETARRCELYGIKMHLARDHEGTALNLAVAHMGIVVFQHFTKINTFSWAKIRKISFKRRKFLIKLHPEGHGYFREVVEFFFEGRNECKNFWKKCVENHGFFRCSSVPRLPRHRTKVISRGSSFRYSGKTQKQIVEFVRYNYMKRETFQRAGSFRASRSLRSSHGSVAPERDVTRSASLHTALSAHPLLPLPPGSDAISLEWDKQPHYLEASLMMKGYTLEEARQAATRPSRYTLTPTAYLTTRDRVGPEVVTHAEVNHHPTPDSPLPRRTTTQSMQSVSQESTWRRESTSRTSAATPPAPADSEASPEETVSSASLCMSPAVEDKSMMPVSSSTPMANGHHTRRASNGDDNANVRVSANLVADSTNSMDILSGGESDVDTLSRRNNNSISSCLTSTLRDPNDTRRRCGDVTYYIAKELLMTERTYKRDLELVTVTWSSKVSCLVSEGVESVTSLARACLALEPLALLQGELVARLELSVGSRALDNEEPEYKRVGTILHDCITKSYDAYVSYMEQVGTLVGLVESARRCSEELERTCSALDAANVLPLSCLLLRPLHRILYLERISELLASTGNGSALAANELCRRLAEVATSQLRHVENHAQLCQLQRLLLGYDKLLVAHRELIRLGCLYKHSGRGLQQRIIFLFSDVLVIASKAGSTQFRAHAALPLHKLGVQTAELSNSFTITGDDINIILSASNEVEFLAWCHALHDAIDEAKQNPTNVDVELTPYEQETTNTSLSTVSGGGALTHVCWHRVTSIHMEHLHLAMRTQLSGFLLRKFKNSHGWQKLWVVFAAFTLFFYKSWQDDRPLASLPLLGYSVCAPSESDNIRKEFVFKLQFKNHIYFFRADSQYTYNRWTEALNTASASYNQNGN